MKSSPGNPINMMVVAFFSGSLIALTGSFTAAPIANPMITPTTRRTRSKSLRRRRKTAPQQERKRWPCPFVPRPMVSRGYAATDNFVGLSLVIMCSPCFIQSNNKSNWILCLVLDSLYAVQRGTTLSVVDIGILICQMSSAPRGQGGDAVEVRDGVVTWHNYWGERKALLWSYLRQVVLPLFSLSWTIPSISEGKLKTKKKTPTF